MNTKKYFLSKLPYLLMNLIVYLLISTLMLIAEISPVILFLIFLLMFSPLCIYIILEFLKKKKFYNDIIGIINNLDKKYLLPEVIKRPNYYESKVIYDVLKECNRNMHEHVNFYKHLQEEYREYIETWVHEIKTPISSSKLILENSNYKDKRALEDELRKVEGYISQVLYYSRSTDVSNDYIVKEFEIKDVLRESIRSNRRDFINKKISVDIEEVHGIVVTDIKWVKFIVNQIIINSIKYSKDKSSIIKAYTTKAEDKIILSIEDNGIGIPKSDINKVFDKGFTGENGRVYGKSTGIGLYLCKKLCEKLGLGIFLTSTETTGTKVNIIFPLGNHMSFK